MFAVISFGCLNRGEGAAPTVCLEAERVTLPHIEKWIIPERNDKVLNISKR